MPKLKHFWLRTTLLRLVHSKEFLKYSNGEIQSFFTWLYGYVYCTALPLGRGIDMTSQGDR